MFASLTWYMTCILLWGMLLNGAFSDDQFWAVQVPWIGKRTATFLEYCLKKLFPGQRAAFRWGPGFDYLVRKVPLDSRACLHRSNRELAFHPLLLPPLFIL